MQGTMDADAQQQPRKGQSSEQSRRKRSFEDEDEDQYELDEAFMNALASDAVKVTPELRKILTGSSVKRTQTDSKDDTVAADDGYVPLQPAPLGPDPLRDAAYGEPEQQVEDQAKREDGTEKDVRYAEKQEYMASEAYKPNTFGDFRSYMRNKRMKLKVQELSMTDDEAQALALQNGDQYGQSSKQAQAYPPLFTGTNIYINGHTNPPYGELRRLIHLHNGQLMPYLDTKSPVTHIIASNLTAKKRIEFKDYRVVRPEWITASIAQKKRLDWRNFRCTEDASGTMVMGALGSRSAVGQQRDAVLQAKRAEKELQEARADAARGDWRTMTSAKGQQGVATSSESLRAFAQSGRGIGSETGVGPWGRTSRQQTLGGWARQDNGSTTEAMAGEKSEADASELQKQDTGSRIAEKVDTPKREVDAERMRDVQPARDAPITPTKQIDPSLHDTDTPMKTPRQVRTPAAQDKFNSYIGTDPITEPAAIAAGQRHPSHPYASRPSNVKAAQLMASPSWRERNTATSEGFLQGFFSKSRLHHLSTWKSEMREMVAQALREAKREQGSADLPANVRRVIFHVDFDAFFVSVGMRNRPDLSGKAVVVCHAESETSTNASTSEIASCNYVARTFGVRNGMSLGQARRFCPDIQTIPYNFAAYNDIAVKFYALLLTHADAIEAVSIDEALIDVSLLLDEMRKGVQSSEEDPTRQALLTAYAGHQSSQGDHWTEEKQLAEALRDQIRVFSDCEASIGIGSNVLLARLATRKAKPGGSFHLRDADVESFLGALDMDDLHGVGWSIRNRCREAFGSSIVADVKAKASRAKFVEMFGAKNGSTIWDKLLGKERDKLEPIKPRQSCGASVNYAIRFVTQDEVRGFVKELSKEVASRLKAISMAGRLCCVSVMVRSQDAPVEAPKFLGHGICDTFNRSAPLARLTDDVETIFQTAWRLIAALNVEPDQFRGMGVSLQKLDYTDERRGSAMAAKQRDAGQSMLSFSVRPDKRLDSMTHLSNRQYVNEGVEEDDTRDAEEDDDDVSLPPSPSIRKHVSFVNLPPPTQFVIPPASEIDPTVLSALPEAIQKQILKRREEVTVSKADTATEASSDSRQSSPASVKPAVTTPEKVQKRKVIDPFERMRAASLTPTKKLTGVRMARTASMLSSSAPSTPSGSQRKRNVRAAAWEPSWSQIDMSVLEELPEEMRDEIMKQMKQSTSRENVAGMTEAGGPSRTTVNSFTDAQQRSHSESPRKRQAFLQFQHESSAKAVTRAAIDAANAPLPPIVPTTRSKNDIADVLDPAKASRQQLIDLDIDPDVFVALPLSVQRETLAEMQQRKSRFRAGQHVIDQTLAQQRLAKRREAMPPHSEDAHALRARRQGDTKVNMPSIKGMRENQDICDLLTSWTRRFAHMGPRERDVQRFARFLIECVDDVAPSAPPTRSNGQRGGNAKTKPAGDTERHSVGPPDGLEKVYDILQWWTFLVQQMRGQCSDAIWNEWWTALEGVHGQVNELIRSQYGGALFVSGLSNRAHV